MADTPVRDLDFDDIKASLKNYLRSQDTFKDYDFEGSSMNILLDLLAYNTHYQAFYANMIANEAFLDSAVVRNSVVSLAKHLNYTPRSIRASSITANVKYTPRQENSLSEAALVRTGGKYLQRGTPFVAKNADGKTVTFIPLENYRFEVVGGEFLARNVILYEGSLKLRSYIYNTKNSRQKIIIDDLNADISTLVVRVQKSVTDTQGSNDVWVRASDVNKLDGASTVYFVQEIEGGRWEVYFGDGVIGKAVENGNLVQIIYLSTSGPDANGIGNTDTATNPAFTSVNDTTFTASVIKDDNGTPQASSGGVEAETIESIKYYAPRNFQAQDRAVTADDYLAILAKEYSQRSDTFLVWGGEENDPPQYGKVFISIKPKNAAKLTITEKQSIARNILAGRNLVTVIPEVVDPDLTYLNMDITVRYDPVKIDVSAEGLSTFVRNNVIGYGEDTLDKFGANFRSSKFVSFVDDLTPSFNSTAISVVLEKRLEPQLGRTLPYTIKFDNPVKHPIDGYTPVVSSSAFYHLDLTSSLVTKPQVATYLDDDGYGNIRLYKVVNSQKTYFPGKIGTIDYAAGQIVLKSFSPIGIIDGSTTIKIRTEPANSDIYVRRNQVLLFNEDEINVTMIQEKTVIDRKASDTGFPFRI